MISFFHKTIKEKRLNPIESFIPGSWILVENPNEEEIQRLVREFNLDEGLPKDGIDPYEVPRMETDNGSIYLYTRVPYSGTGSVATVPILIVLGETSLWRRYRLFLFLCLIVCQRGRRTNSTENGDAHQG